MDHLKSEIAARGYPDVVASAALRLLVDLGLLNKTDEREGGSADRFRWALRGFELQDLKSLRSLDRDAASPQLGNLALTKARKNDDLKRCLFGQFLP